jgi:methionyl-tRNA synthetase
VKFINAKYGGIIPKGTPETQEDSLYKDVNNLYKSYLEALESVKIRQGLKLIMEISARGNLYLQDNKIDNVLFANHRSRCDTVVFSAANLCYILASIIYPYMPSTSALILKQLRLPMRKLLDTWTMDVYPGHKIGEAAYLFKRIEDSKIDFCRAKYSGQAETKPPKQQKPVAEQKIAEMTPELLILNERITEQGNIVRKLKAEKADPNTIKEAVAKLLELKKLK